jgi:class 3 adenylate cyclase
MEPIVVVLQPGRQALYLMLREPLVIGRESEGLALADAQVSRRHLELRSDDGAVIVTDLGSTNGTFLDGERVSGPMALQPGATLVLGETAVRVVATAPTGGDDHGRGTVLGARAGEGAGDELRRTSIDVVADLVTADPGPAQVGSDTMTILFSDIESHTEQVAAMGDAAWFDLLEAHNRVFREELARAGGREVKAQGDGFMLAFTSVRRALTFAVAAQQRLEEHSIADPDRAIRVRMGLHTGEAIADPSGDLFGRHVIKAARIANLAAGGQVLVSATVREIATGHQGLKFSDGEAVELKGLDGLHTIHEVHASAL